MNKKLLATAALAGLFTVSMIAAPALAAEGAADTHAAKAADGKEKHACKGKNSCAGQGADGKNACKGKGSCRTDEGK